MKAFKTLAICGLFSLMVAGCKKEEYGDVAIKMTDAPADYLEVNVDIRSVMVHYSMGNAWVALNTNNGVYNLIDLRNNITTLLATGNEFPTGKVTQLRMILGSNNTVMLADSVVMPLKVPSGIESGVKVNVDAEIRSDNDLVITLDFDADQSVNLNGSGDYILQPVIKVKSIE